MKSVGEAMAIGRTFKEALQKSIRSLEIDRYGLGADGKEKLKEENLNYMLSVPNQDRVFHIKYAFEIGKTVDEIFSFTKIDPWFLNNIKDLVEFEKEFNNLKLSSLDYEKLVEAKKLGYSDVQIAHLCACSENDVRSLRKKLNINAVFKTVDTCAAEFEAYTPYYYSTYESSTETAKSEKRKIIILGSGPNRIGQGIEFDYCCVHASFALHENNYETIMVNCNPETVSTDYDTSDRLYFEPLTYEDVMNIIEAEKPYGVIVQFGGQTPLKLASRLQESGVNILGTSPDSIDLAEDRKRFGSILNSLDIPQPENGTALNVEDARKTAAKIGYPLLVRPSYVLGGRAMVIVYDEENMISYVENAFRVSPGFPVLIDKFLEQATEVDVDAVFDGEEMFIGGIMEHIEEAGIHSGDSACVIPPFALGAETIKKIKEYTFKIAKALKVIGLINIQYAVKNSQYMFLKLIRELQELFRL